MGISSGFRNSIEEMISSSGRAGNGEQELDKAHHDRVEAAAIETGNRADHNAQPARRSITERTATVSEMRPAYNMREK